MKAKKPTHQELLAKRARFQCYMSWFGLFDAMGIRTHAMTCTRREVEEELAEMTKQIKRGDMRDEQTNVRTHS